MNNRDARKRARHELGLPRRRQDTGLGGAKGRARLIPGKRAETLAPKIAVVTGGG
ncbi:hypothetical protein BH18ACT13_BH18ACT13_11470 [soil metagenome]